MTEPVSTVLVKTLLTPVLLLRPGDAAALLVKKTQKNPQIIKKDLIPWKEMFTGNILGKNI